MMLPDIYHFEYRVSKNDQSHINYNGRNAFVCSFILSTTSIRLIVYRTPSLQIYELFALLQNFRANILVYYSILVTTSDF